MTWVLIIGFRAYATGALATATFASADLCHKAGKKMVEAYELTQPLLAIEGSMFYVCAPTGLDNVSPPK